MDLGEKVLKISLDGRIVLFILNFFLGKLVFCNISGFIRCFG